MLQERVGAGLLDDGVAVDEQGVAGDHDPVDVVAHLGVDVDLGVDLAIVVDLGLGQLEELRGAHALTRALGALHALEDVLRLGAQLERGAAVELDAQRAEVRGVPRLEHVELQRQLAVLRAQQVAQGRVLDLRHVDVGQRLGEHVRVDLELAVGELRRTDASVEEVGLDGVGVDRGDVEQELHAPSGLRQGVVDGEVGDGELAGACTQPSPPSPDLPTTGPPSAAPPGPGRRSARRRCARASMRSRSGSPVHSSM